MDTNPTTNFIEYNYVSGTEPQVGISSTTITFNGPNNSPDSYTNLGASGSNYKTIGFTYFSNYENNVYFRITPNQGAIDVYYIISPNPPNSNSNSNTTQNLNATQYYNYLDGLNNTNLGTTNN